MNSGPSLDKRQAWETDTAPNADIPEEVEMSLDISSPEYERSQ
jgi:hypothetical protein